MSESRSVLQRPKNWSEVIPNEVAVYQQSSWDMWGGVQVVHMAHRLPEFETHSNFHAMFVYLGEPGSLTVRGQGGKQKIAMTPGQFSFVPSFCRFWSEPSQVTMENLGVMISPQWLQDVCDNSETPVNPSSLRPILAEENNRIAEILKLLNDDLKEGSPYGKVFGDSLISVLGKTLLSHASPDRRDVGSQKLSDRQVQLVFSYVMENLGQEIRLRDLAGLVGYSEFHFHRLFKEATGMRVHEYIVRARVDKAEGLLARTDWPVAMIAAEAGFSDSGHLARHLRRRRGISPAQFRAQSQR